MAEDPELANWLQALFHDLDVRAPHGIAWTMSRSSAPLQVSVAPAGAPTVELTLRDGGLLARLALMEQLQHHIDAAWDVRLPPCPEHGTGMRAVRTGSTIRLARADSPEAEAIRAERAERAAGRRRRRG